MNFITTPVALCHGDSQVGLTRSHTASSSRCGRTHACRTRMAFGGTTLPRSVRPSSHVQTMPISWHTSIERDVFGQSDIAALGMRACGIPAFLGHPPELSRFAGPVLWPPRTAVPQLWPSATALGSQVRCHWLAEASRHCPLVRLCAVSIAGLACPSRAAPPSRTVSRQARCPNAPRLPAPPGMASAEWMRLEPWRPGFSCVFSAACFATFPRNGSGTICASSGHPAPAITNTDTTTEDRLGPIHGRLSRAAIQGSYPGWLSRAASTQAAVHDSMRGRASDSATCFAIRSL